MDNVSVTIRSVLLTDPRAAQLSPSQIDALVLQLSRRASARGVDSRAILWRPVVPPIPGAQGNPPASTASQSTFSEGGGTQALPSEACGMQPAVICNINKAFGLPGSSSLIPVTVGVVGIILLALAAFIIEMRHRAR